MRPLEDSFLQLHQSITEDTVTVLVSVVVVVFFERDKVCAYSGCILLIISHLLCVFLFELKETVVKLKIFADNFSSYTHFLQKILPYQLKRSVLCACACNREMEWRTLY